MVGERYGFRVGSKNLQWLIIVAVKTQTVSRLNNFNSNVYIFTVFFNSLLSKFFCHDGSGSQYKIYNGGSQYKIQHENFVRDVFAIVNFSINLRSEVTAETVSDIFVFELF